MKKYEQEIYDDVYMDFIGEWQGDIDDNGMWSLIQNEQVGAITIDCWKTEEGRTVHDEYEEVLTVALNSAEVPNPNLEIKKFENKYGNFTVATIYRIDADFHIYLSITGNEDFYSLATYTYPKITDQFEVAKTMIDSIRFKSEKRRFIFKPQN